MSFLQKADYIHVCRWFDHVRMRRRGMDLKLIVKSSVTITEFSSINAARPTLGKRLQC